ncbi:MAG: hypothetical protein K0R24_17 [Gammaproteobacteria bacterium]|jgi:hypothetical protein|nr:hypothetical protein [Gammaproteobacteria bacterium]
MYSNQSNSHHSESQETLANKVAALEKQVAALSRYSLFPTPVTSDISSSSTSSSITSPPQSILKSNDGLSPSQINFQKHLIQACNNAELVKVKSLIQQGADPTIPDENGQIALGAAVWGLALDVVNYLTERDHYPQSDINEILLQNQLKHSLVLPAYLPKNTFKYLAQLYDSGEVSWLFNENVLKDPRFSVAPEVLHNLDKYRFVKEVTCSSKSILYRQFHYPKNYQGKFEARPIQDVSFVSYFAPIPSNLLNIKCYKELLERMDRKVRALGGNIDRKYRLQEHPISIPVFSPTISL